MAALTLNRPDRHNSLTPELLEQLLAGLRGKRLLWAGLPVAERLEAGRRQFVEQIGTAEAQSGMHLFLKQLKQGKFGPA